MRYIQRPEGSLTPTRKRGGQGKERKKVFQLKERKKDQEEEVLSVKGEVISLPEIKRER